MRTTGWSPYLGWLGSSTQMGRDSPINDTMLVKRGLDMLSTTSVKRGLDLLGVDEKELQRQ
jgi:hypothetical protein